MKKIFCLFILLSFSISLWAQASANPNDTFYQKASVWEIKGLVPHLPQFRPYPVHIIKNILETVIQSEDESESQNAKNEYERIFGKKWNFNTEIEDTYASNKNIIPVYFSFTGDIPFYPFLALGYHAGAYLTTADSEKAVTPLFTNIEHDSLSDSAGIGPFTCYTDMNLVTSFGNSLFYGNAGISRFGFGPFMGNGIALNDTCFHMAGLTYNAMFFENFTYGHFYASIGATNNAGVEQNNTKYLSLHSVNWDITKNLSASFYEAAVFGRRNELSYALPVPYLVNEILTGVNDNIWMGVIGEYRPVNNLKLAFDVFVDDFAVRSLTLDDKYRLALQTGIFWTPETPFIEILSMDYQAVMPYVYTHVEYDDFIHYNISKENINYQNYTHYGMGLGASIPPDSDRISLKGTIKPVPFLNIEFLGTYTRHQNVNEALTFEEQKIYMEASDDEYLTDGSIFNHADQYNNGTSFSYMNSAQYHLLFMKGKHTMHNFGLDLKTTFDLPKTKGGNLSFLLEYAFDYTINKGIDRNMFSTGHTDVTEEDVKKEIENWASGLYNEFTQYITVGLKYRF